MGARRLKRGVCRRCKCTDGHACRVHEQGLFGKAPVACHWVDQEHTRCSACFTVHMPRGFARYHFRTLPATEVQHAYSR